MDRFDRGGAAHQASGPVGLTLPGPRPAEVLAAQPRPEGRAPVEERVLDAALVCIARLGVRKTTLDDVAAEAGCSRATVYRAFPGGRDALLADLAEREVDRAKAALAVRLADATGVEDMLVVAISGAASALVHHPAWAYLARHEPGVVLPHLAFDRLDPVLDRAVAFLAPWLARDLDPAAADELAELAARLVVLSTGPAARVDLTDPAVVRRVVTTFVLPGLAPGWRQGGAP